MENSISGGSELAGGLELFGNFSCWVSDLAGGGLDLCNHVNKWILKSTLSWFAFST